MKTMLTLCKNLLFIGLHVKANFVTSVQVHVTFYIFKGVGKVEHFLWKSQTTIKHCLKSLRHAYLPKNVTFKINQKNSMYRSTS